MPLLSNTLVAQALLPARVFRPRFLSLGIGAFAGDHFQ